MSDLELDLKITNLFNQGWWIEYMVSNEDNLLIIFALRLNI